MFRRVNLINQVLKTQSVAYASTGTKAKNAIPLITCKNTKFNLMLDENIVKKAAHGNISEEIELASKGWQHYKAKGDHFIIHPIRNVIESNLKNSTDVEELGLNEQLLRNLRDKHNIDKTTKMQTEAIQMILKKEHVLLAAETGCGKVC